MSEERVFQIERFYFGTLIQNGQPIGAPKVIAKSSGVTQEQVQECLRIVRLKPPEPELTTHDMPSALALWRAANTFILLKAQRTPEGYPQLQYLLIPEMGMRWLGGNFRTFESLGYEEMRSFAAPQYDLTPLTLENPQVLSAEEQVELLYDLFYYCGDHIKNVEGILAALIHNQPIAILNSPLSLQKRMGFIQGLLCLLPVPARVNINWISHMAGVEGAAAQISFVASAANLDGYLVYDWEMGKLLTPPPPDKYSKFIASQMRLDPSLVVEVTTSIARTAVWRALRKDSLPDALHFASRRAAIDAAVSNNQPADRETVAAILRQDPTLSDEMRLRYARHLLAITLALDEDLHHADVIPVVAATNRPVAEAIYYQLREVAVGQNPLRVVDLVERWLNTVPQASVIPWNQLAYIATLTHLENLLNAGRVQDVVEFLERIQRASRALRMEKVVPQVIALIQPAAAYDAHLALAVFLLGAEYLPIAGFQRLVGDAQLVGKLPVRLQHALFFLQPSPRPNPPPNLLISVVGDLEAQHRMLVVGRLAELAVQLKREHLIDARSLEGLLRAVQAGYAWRFSGLIQYLAEKFSQPAMLRQLSQGALEMLPHLYFSTDRHQMGIQLLEHYQNTLYGSANLPKFTEVIGNVFLNANLPIESLEKIFALIEHSKLRPEPRTRAYCAALIAVEWGLAYKSLARRLTIMLYNDPGLLEVIGIENGLTLLAYHGELKDSVSVMELGAVLLDAALQMGKHGVELVIRVWDYLDKAPDLAEVRLDLLRQYVRLADSSFAMHLPAYFDKKIGGGLGSTLQATYVMRQLLAGRDLLKFAQALTVTARLLIDVATTYYEPKEPPPNHRLRAGLNQMTGGLEDVHRDAIGAALERIVRDVFVLGHQHERSKKAEERDALLLRNEIVPQTGIDFLIFVGGRFSRRKLAQVDLSREAMTHLFGARSAVMLLDEVVIAADFLESLLRAFPVDAAPQFDLYSLQGELDNLWKQLSLYDQRQAQEALSQDSQYLAQVMLHMAWQVKDRLFSNKNLETGQQVPQNGMEALRWVAGYFKRTHRS